MNLCNPLYKERGKVVSGSLDDEIERIYKEGGCKKEEEGSKRDNGVGSNDAGEGGGPHFWRTDLKMTRSTSPLPPDRVLLLLTPKLPRMKMTKRGTWWKYLSSRYAQWDTWRP